MSEGRRGRSHITIEAPSLRIPSGEQMIAPSEWDRLEDYRNVRGACRYKKDPISIIRTICTSIKIVRKVLEMWNVREQIQRTSTAKMIVAVGVCWALLIAQLTLNPRSRRVVIRIIYVLVGLSTIVGTVGTTGVLVYKKWHRKDEAADHLSLPSLESESRSNSK